MKPNEKLRETIFEVIDNQIKLNMPPETKQTFERLIALDYSEFVAKQLIGQCLAIELFGILKHKKTYDEKRYIENLKKLPKEPFD